MSASVAGKLLVAVPTLRDPNFTRTVVLVCEHEERGAMGLILNRRAGLVLGEALSDLPGALGRSDPLWRGGPVEPETVFILHDSSAIGGNEVLPGVFLSGDVDVLQALLSNGESHRFRLYAGYSGWGEGQLDDELERKGWVVAEATSDDVFSGGDATWGEVLRRMGGRYAIMALAPPDPDAN